MEILVIKPLKVTLKRTEVLLEKIEDDSIGEYFSVQVARDYGLTHILAVHCPDYHKFLVSLAEKNQRKKEGEEKEIDEDRIGNFRLGFGGDDVTCFPHVRMFRAFSNYDRVIHSEMINNPDERVGLGGYYFFDSYHIKNEVTHEHIERAYQSTQSAIHAAHMLVTCENDYGCFVALCEQGGYYAAKSLTCDGHLFNNAAIAYEYISSKTQDPRVAFLNLNYNHACGSQNLYFSHNCPYTVSVHGESGYPPYSGKPLETGLGIGNLRNLNIVLPDYSTIGRYLVSLEKAIKSIKDTYPDTVIITVSFNLLIDSVTGKFTITSRDFTTLGERIRSSLLDSGINVLFIVEGIDTYQTGVSSDSVIIDAFVNLFMPFALYF